MFKCSSTRSSAGRPLRRALALLQVPDNEANALLSEDAKEEIYRMHCTDPNWCASQSRLRAPCKASPPLLRARTVQRLLSPAFLPSEAVY